MRATVLFPNKFDERLTPTCFRFLFMTNLLFCRLLDVNSGPLTEVERWRRRQRVLAGITEQLKSKECKNVIGILIQAKSRSLRAWRTIDML